MKTSGLILCIMFLTASLNASAQEPELKLKLDNFTDEKTELPSEIINPDRIEKPIKSEKTRKPSKWHFGVTAGYRHSGNEWEINASGESFNYYNNTRTSPGFTVGGTASIPIDDVLSFDTGLSLSMWGFGYKTPSISMKFSRFVAEIPTLITFFEPDAIIPLFLQVGFVTGIYLGGTHKIDTSWHNDDWDSRPSRDVFSKVTFGIAAGIGYGPVSLQYIQNFNGSMSERFRRSWEENTGGTLESHKSWGVTLAYTYWF